MNKNIKKESCYYCLDTGAIDNNGNTPKDSIGPFKGCPVCKLDKTSKMMDEIILSEVKDLHMDKYVWALDVTKKNPEIGQVTENIVLGLSNYINDQVYAINPITKAPDYSKQASYLDTEHNFKDFFRIVFHGSLYYADIVKILRNARVDMTNGLVKLNRVNTKDYL